MASNTVRDIMNAKLLYIGANDRLSLARRHIVRFGVTTIPVLDETHRPIGTVSLRDLAREGDEVRPHDIACTVKDTEGVEEAARKLVDTEAHHLVVVDAKGIAVGMVSSVDFL